MRALQLSVLALGIAAVLAVSALLVARNLPRGTSQDAGRIETAVQDPARPADPPEEHVASIKESIATAFSPPPQAQAPAAPVDLPLITLPAGVQKSPTEPLIIAPSGTSEGDAAARGKGPASAVPRLSLSQAQEERVRYVLQSHNIIQSEATDLPLRPGGTVPKEIVLSPLPIELGNVVPDYRSYSYVFIQDRIVIVNTNSREIGLVLPF
jgi:hypothetical protein